MLLKSIKYEIEMKFFLHNEMKCLYNTQPIRESATCSTLMIFYLLFADQIVCTWACTSCLIIDEIYSLAMFTTFLYLNRNRPRRSVSTRRKKFSLKKNEIQPCVDAFFSHQQLFIHTFFICSIHQFSSFFELTCYWRMTTRRNLWIFMEFSSKQKIVKIIFQKDCKLFIGN